MKSEADNDSIIIMQQCEQVLYSLCINNDHGLNDLLKQMEVILLGRLTSKNHLLNVVW